MALSDEARVLMAMQTFEHPVTDLKSVIINPLHRAVDEVIRLGFVETAYVLTEAGEKFVEAEWCEHQKSQKSFVLSKSEEQ